MVPTAFAISAGTACFSTTGPASFAINKTDIVISRYDE